MSRVQNNRYLGLYNTINTVSKNGDKKEADVSHAHIILSADYDGRNIDGFSFRPVFVFLL